MITKTKLKSLLLILIAAIPLLGAIYFANNSGDYINVANNKNTISFTLDGSNTPTDIGPTINWGGVTDFNSTQRYTEFHYKNVTKIGNEHITFPQNVDVKYIQNSSPLNDSRIANYSIEFKISTQDTNWAAVEVKTSNRYNEELAGYDNGIVCTLNTWDNKVSSKIYNLTLTEPYFSISHAGGSDIDGIALDYLTISYYC